MLIIENPLRLLIIALCIMICLLLFFKIVNFCEKVNSKNKTKKDNKSAASDKKQESIVEKKDGDAKNSDGEKVTDIPFDSKNMTNYLYDRFVISPTTDDAIYYQDNISQSFLSEEKYAEIRDKKVHIDVKPVESSQYSRNHLYRKIEELTSNNRLEKEKMLDEFNNLSKEMKLLLIENIMQNID